MNGTGKTPKLVRRGDPIYASDFNDIQRALAPLNGQSAPPPSQIQNPFLESGWVWVKNDTATAVARFETMRLKTEDLLTFTGYDLSKDSRGIILKITDVSTFSNPTLAIPLEPIAEGGIGRACISGLCRAKLLSGSTSLKNATVSGRKLQPASSGPVSLLSSPSSSDEITALIFIDRATVGGSVTYAFPPSGGIPAATYNSTTKTLTPGTAMCKLAIQESPGVYKEGSESVLVENQISSAIALSGRPMTIAMNKFGQWEIIVEDCIAGSNTNPDNPTPSPSPDPISEGTSKSISLGYILGV